MRLIKLAALAVLLAPAAPAAAAPCYDLGHPGNCRWTNERQFLAACHGWRDAAGGCHWEPQQTRGLAGSGMGPRGYVGRCGGGTC